MLVAILTCPRVFLGGFLIPGLGSAFQRFERPLLGAERGAGRGAGALRRTGGAFTVVRGGDVRGCVNERLLFVRFGGGVVTRFVLRLGFTKLFGRLVRFGAGVTRRVLRCGRWPILVERLVEGRS